MLVRLPFLAQKQLPVEVDLEAILKPIGGGVE
jgi:hypothetical protein